MKGLSNLCPELRNGLKSSKFTSVYLNEFFLFRLIYNLLLLAVKRVTGKARLQFTRVPYTHWSLSFYNDPILELEVQSQFQGRQLQPQIISLITGQIRRAVRRKHTLPRYKMRYKPFFRRLNDEDIDLSEVLFLIELF